MTNGDFKLLCRSTEGNFFKDSPGPPQAILCESAHLTSVTFGSLNAPTPIQPEAVLNFSLS